MISQRQAKHADYSTALRDGNAERNRARALMPGEQGGFTEQRDVDVYSGFIHRLFKKTHVYL